MDDVSQERSTIATTASLIHENLEDAEEILDIMVDGVSLLMFIDDY